MALWRVCGITLFVVRRFCLSGRELNTCRLYLMVFLAPCILGVRPI